MNLNDIKNHLIKETTEGLKEMFGHPYVPIQWQYMADEIVKERETMAETFRNLDLSFPIPSPEETEPPFTIRDEAIYQLHYDDGRGNTTVLINGCLHQWETKALFTGTYSRCTVCGQEET